MGAAAALADYQHEHIETSEVEAQERTIDTIDMLREFFGDRLISSIDIPLCREYGEASRTARVVAKTYRDDKTRIPACDATIRRGLVMLTAASTMR